MQQAGNPNMAENALADTARADYLIMQKFCYESRQLARYRFHRPR
jgi:hypothetical protein